MMQPNLIPTLDPNPLPAPYWVFKLLLVVTFFLHVLAMNFLLGGAILAIGSKLRSKDAAQGKRISYDLAKKLPVFMPATITLGIAPLLFVQVLYGQYFYTSSILMAWPWFLVLAFITVAYYGFYYVSFRGGQESSTLTRVLWLSTILITIVGFLFSNNLTLSQSPSRWGSKYFASPSGWSLNLTEPSLFPRFLHFFVAALAMGGILLVFLALAHWNHDRAYAQRLLRFGGKTFMYATMAQFIVGILFVASLPHEMWMLFLGGNPLATTLLLISILGGLASIFLMSFALRKENLRIAGVVVPGILGLVILCMCIVREILRDALLQPWYHPGQFAVQTQWSVFPLFLVIFLAGVVLWFIMLARFGIFHGAKS